MRVIKTIKEVIYIYRKYETSGTNIICILIITIPYHVFTHLKYTLQKNR